MRENAKLLCAEKSFRGNECFYLKINLLFLGKKYVGENNCVFNRFYYYVVEFRITRYSILIFSSLIGNLTTEN